MNKVIVNVTPERLRNIGKNVRGSGFTTAEAESFMVLHAQQIEETLLRALKDFVQEKLR